MKAIFVNVDGQSYPNIRLEAESDAEEVALKAIYDGSYTESDYILRSREVSGDRTTSITIGSDGGS